MAAVCGVAIANKKVAAWHCFKHVGEVFAAGERLGLPHHVVFAHQGDCHFARDFRFCRGVNQHRVAGQELDLGLHAKALRLCLYQFHNAPAQQFAHAPV